MCDDGDGQMMRMAMVMMAMVMTTTTTLCIRHYIKNEGPHESKSPAFNSVAAKTQSCRLVHLIDCSCKPAVRPAWCLMALHTGGKTGSALSRMVRTVSPPMVLPVLDGHRVHFVCESNSLLVVWLFCPPPHIDPVTSDFDCRE